MLTPAKYWRVFCHLDTNILKPATTFVLPTEMASQKSPPAVGHGITIAAYDEVSQIGMLRWIGVIISRSESICEVNWRPTASQIWVDTSTGRRYWESGAFAFSAKKVGDYGLHELWNSHFPELQLRDHAKMVSTPKPFPKSRISNIDPQRLNPIEVIGEPCNGVKSGVVYVLKSAYGYKVGRTRSVPDRMRAFGVKLPFIYTIPLIAWFEDCHLAEHRYHQRFADKRINGEWFDLDEKDIELIRLRA